MILYKKCEICATNHSHPDIEAGQHTNGPAMIWLRSSGDVEWIKTGQTQMHRVRGSIDELGVDAYVALLRGLDG